LETPALVLYGYANVIRDYGVKAMQLTPHMDEEEVVWFMH